MRTSRAALPTYITKDGSTICELMHPQTHGNSRQSLAEATVPPGGATFVHRHPVSEELYHFLEGEGYMLLDGEEIAVKAGDTVAIAPAAWHGLRNTGTQTLRLLCCCSPAYSHEDTELEAQS